MELTEQQLDSQSVFTGEFLQVNRDQVALPDGSRGVREYIRHPGAVAELALTDEQQLVLERQFRYPAGRTFIEIPAGKLEPAESPLQCGQRELQEETGYLACEWLPLGRAFPCIGYADEEIHYYLARGLTLSQRQLDAGEFLEVFTLPLAAVRQLAVSGEINDSKTLVGLFWLFAYLEGRVSHAPV